MTEANNGTNAPRSGRWWQWLLWLAGGLLALVVLLYFVVTSNAFFQGVILPRVGRALNADVVVRDAEISPFSRVVLREVKVTPRELSRVFSATSVSLRYSLLAILRGHILVDEVAVVAPTVTVIENADGARNLDPLLKSAPPTAAPKSMPSPAAPAKPSAPPALDIKSVRLEQATIRYVKNLKGGGHQTIVLAPVTIRLSDINNGATGKLEAAVTLALDKAAGPSAPATTLQASLTATFTVQLTPDLRPGAIQGTADLNVDKATGDFADFAALAAKLDCEVTPTTIKQLALRFTRAGASLGEVRVSGRFDPATSEGKLDVALLALDRQVLNLAGATAGLDFGTTTVNATNEIELTKGGAVITAGGTVNLARLQVTRQHQTTPTLDLRCDYQVTVNRPAQSARLQTLTLLGTQDQRPLLQAELTNPMTIAWGGASNDVGDATLNLTIANLNLADWQAFAAGTAPSGTANLKLKLRSQQGGQQLAFDLDGQVAQLSARAANGTLPPVDVHLVARGQCVDLQQFTLSEYRLDLAQQGQSILTIAGAGTFDRRQQNADVQVSLQAVLGRLALVVAPWSAAVGTAAPTGTATVKLKLGAQQGSKQLTFDLDGQVDQLAARVNNEPTTPVNLRLVARGRSRDLQQFDLSAGQLEVTQQGQPVLTASCTGTFDRAGHSTDLQLALQAALDRLATLRPQPNITCATGTLAITGRLTDQPPAQRVTGQLTLADFTGRYGDYRLENFGATVDLDVARRGEQLEIRKATGQLRQGPTAGGKFDASGNYDRSRQTGQVTVKLAEFTQNDLGPFLAPSLGEKKLVSIALNTTASAGFDAQGNATVKADVQLANLVVQDPHQQSPAPPLAGRLQIDMAASNKVATIRLGQLTLTPTARAKNELRLSGAIDFTKTSAITGDLKVAADSLDATAYYDLFAGTNKTRKTTGPGEAKGSAQPTAAATSKEPASEPAAVTLPVRNFTADLAAGHVYLREVDIANLQVTAKFDGGHVVLKPCQLTLNGAPLNATVDLDLGVPGYRYDVVFTADKVPLAPLVDSFSPTYHDKAQGDLVANLQVKGAGVTGRNLRQNLTGQVTLSLTNANIQIVGPKVKNVLTPIALVLGAPELLNAPLDYVNANLQFGGGQIEIRQFVAHSAAFLAESQGTIPIADVLTDSPLHQPVEISLAQSLAAKLRFATGPATAGYQKLPAFVRLTGTLGDPQAKTDKKVIVGLMATGIGGALGGQTGGLIQGISGILTGQPQTTNAPSSTPQKPAPINPFDLLKGFVK